MATLVGQTVSHYTILEHLGSGGMGLVYKARDLRLDRTVALKFLPPELTRDPNARHRLLHEARATCILQHANIATIHDIEETGDGRIFIVMDCYEGETLKQRLERETIGIDEATGIARQIAEGLQAAHDKGVVHRDLKPANIILTTGGQVKIIDFGIARLAGWTKVTHEGSTLGTTLYMSPEQARGEDVDARADIWALGVVHYEMLSGKTPFTSDYESAVIYAILNEEPKPITDLLPGVPQQIGALIARCLEKNREARPGSMRDVLAVLDTHPDHRATPLSLLRHVPMPARIVLPAVLFAAAVVGWWLARHDTPHALPPAEERWRIAILPFEDLTQEKNGTHWPLMIQAMMVDRLTGTEEIGVIDATTTNWIVQGSAAGSRPPSKPEQLERMREAEISCVVQGKLTRSDTSYAVQWTLTEVATQEVRLAPVEKFSGEQDLGRVARMLSEDILSFFRVRTLMGGKEADLKPWLKNRTRSIASLEAFLQGSSYAYRNRSEARTYFSRAIALDSTFIPPRIWLLSSLLGEGRVDEARHHYAILLRLDSAANPFESALIRYSGASIGGDARAQKSALVEALEYSPRNYTLLYLLGRVCYEQGDYSGSAQAFRPLVDMNWQYQGVYYMLGVCYVQTGRLGEARELLQRSLRLAPVYLHTYALLAALELVAGDRDSSDLHVGTYLRTGEESSHPLDTLLYWLAGCYVLCGERDSATVCYRRAIDLDPRNVRYHLDLAHVLLSRDSLPASEAILKRALQLDPSAAEAHLLLGKIYDRGRDRKGAIQHYTAYLMGDSTSGEAREARTRVAALSLTTTHR